MSHTESVALIFAVRVSKVTKKVFMFSHSVKTSLSVEWKEIEGPITIKMPLSRIHFYIHTTENLICYFLGSSLILFVKVKISLKSL